MKHGFKRRGLCLLLALCMIGSLCISAFARSSPTLDAYRAICTAGSGGRIDITIDVSGVADMDKIGATTIYLYESRDGESYYFVKRFDSSAWPKMMTYNTDDYYATPVYYNGVAGRYYMATAYFYAELDGVSDTKRYETSAVRAVS